MGARLEIVKGERFGRLSVIKEMPIEIIDHRHFRRFKLRCECGNRIECRLQSLRTTKRPTQSCGCYQQERASKARTTHKMSGTHLYWVYDQMKRRCHDPEHKSYDNYGGRGIKVCKTWRNDPQSFFDWALENGYEQGLEIDRRNNDKGYRPNNCRFVTRQINNMNKRTTKWIRFRGQRMKFADAVKEHGAVEYKVVLKRLRDGWSVRKALLTPKMH